MFKNHLDTRMASVKKSKKKALIAYITGGYPPFPQQSKLLKVLDQSGVDVVELGIPFSDPVADGPTIQWSSQEALAHGASLRKILRWAKSMRPKVSMPFVVMSYMNPIYHYGLKRFAKDAARAGISGVIVPDLILDEGGEFEAILRRHKIHMIYLVTPTTPRQRQKQIIARSGGFVYAVSVTGVTGARRMYTPQTKSWLRSLTRSTRKPVCVGFGISGPDQIRQLRSQVDGFIVGSALIDVIRKNRSAARPKKVGQFMKKLSRECSHGG